METDLLELIYISLRKLGYSVIVYDKIIGRCTNDYIQGDLNDTQKLKEVINEGDIVIHLAGNAIPALSGRDIRKEIDNDVISSINLFEICSYKRVKKIIFSSSGGAIYGINTKASLSEECIPMPISTYGINKLMIEHYLRYIGRRDNIRVVSLRIANPYGYAQRAFTGQGIIATYIASAYIGKKIEIWGDGSSVRDYIYIEDVIKAILRVIEISDVNGVYNIGTGKGASINDILAIIKKLLPLPAFNIIYLPELNVDVKRNILNCRKANIELGWKAEVEIIDGIKRMITMWDSEELAFTKGTKE